jgi:hypothetical protein
MKRWADDELRSLNGQMEFVLRKALRDRKRLDPPVAAESVEDWPQPPEPAGNDE